MNQQASGQSEPGPNPRGNAVREAAYLRRVKSLEQMGMYDEAIEILHKAIELSPAKASHRVRLAELYRAQRKMMPAIKAMKRAIELSPTDPSSQETLLQLYLEAGELDDAIEESKLVIRRHPKNLFALDVLGLAYLQKGYLDKALQITTKLIHLNPRDATNHFKKGVLFQQKGDCANAIAEFSRVIEMEPESEMSEAAREAVMALDGYQLRQIVTLATEDKLFLTKLMRDPDIAVAERGFILSHGGLMMLRQVDFDDIFDSTTDTQRYYH